MARRNVEAKIQQGKNVLGKPPVDKFETVKTWKDVRAQEQRQGVYALRFSFEGSTLAVGYGNGAVDLICVETGKMMVNLRAARYGGFQVMHMQYNPFRTKMLYVSTSEGDVISCDTTKDSSCEESNNVLCTEEGNEINCFDFCSDGYVFATSGKDLGVRLYDTKTNKLVSLWEGSNVASAVGSSKRNSMRVFALKFHPFREDMFITGGWDNQLKIWDIRSRDGVVRSISGPHICGDSIDMRDDEILTGSWVGQRALQRWTYLDGIPVKDIFFPHNEDGDFLYCAQYCDKDVVIAGGSGTNSVEAIDMVTDQHIGGIQMKKPVQCLDSTFGGRIFAVAGQDNQIKIATIL